MRKITTFLMMALLAFNLHSQITYPVVFSDNLETSNGIPSNMSVYKQTIWTAVNGTNNPYVYTGIIWKDIFSDNTTANNKTYRVSAYAENRPGGTGSQCLKFDMTGLAFGTYATPFAVRLRSLDNIISFNTGAGESITKYEVTFWARTDGADKVCMLNTKAPNTYLTITSTWQQFTITRYCTGTGVTALGFDFYPLADNSDYSVYIDDFVVKQRLIPYTSAATSINSTGFTANWAAVAGATSYNITVEKSDGGTPAVWTAIAGSPFSATTNSKDFTGLDANAIYRYSVTATDGTLTTFISNVTSVTTSTTTGLENYKIMSAYAREGKIYFELTSQQHVTIYNAAAQKVYSFVANAGINMVTAPKAGMYIIKTLSDTNKLIVK